MNLTTEDLRTAMDAYTDALDVPDSEATLAAVASKVDRDGGRRRRQLVAAVAAAALVAATLTGWGLIGSKNAAPSPAEQVKKAGSHLPLFIEGYQLVGVTMVAPQYGDPQPYLQLSGKASGLRFTPVADATRSGAVAMIWCDDVLTVEPAMTDAAALVSPHGNTVPCSGGRYQDYEGPAFKAVAPVGADSPQVAIVSANPNVRSRVPVGIYVPAQWGDYPAPSQVSSLPSFSSWTVEQGSTASTPITGAPGSSATTSVTARETGPTVVLVAVESASAGQFRAIVNGVDVRPQEAQAATNTWVPVWMPGGSTVFHLELNLTAGQKVTVRVDSQNNPGQWRTWTTLTSERALNNPVPNRFGDTAQTSQTGSP